jgi:hypothetical protein
VHAYAFALLILRRSLLVATAPVDSAADEYTGPQRHSLGWTRSLPGSRGGLRRSHNGIKMTGLGNSGAHPADYGVPRCQLEFGLASLLSPGGPGCVRLEIVMHEAHFARAGLAVAEFASGV